MTFNDQAHRALLKVSGDNQEGVPNETLAKLLVIGAQDTDGSALVGISVTFTVLVGGGTLSTTKTMTDANGRAQSLLTLGPNLGTNTVSVAATEIERVEIFNAISDTLPTVYRLSIPAGISLIHVPLKVTAVDDVPRPSDRLATSTTLSAVQIPSPISSPLTPKLRSGSAISDPRTETHPPIGG